MRDPNRSDLVDHDPEEFEDEAEAREKNEEEEFEEEDLSDSPHEISPTPAGRSMEPDDGYRLLGGKCRKICEAIAAVDKEWTLVRGYFHCPLWGKRGHWWLKSKDGVIYDPTVKQFPMPAAGEYEEFNGHVECSQCGKDMLEQEAQLESNYAFCSTKCHMRFVGL